MITSFCYTNPLYEKERAIYELTVEGREYIALTSKFIYKYLFLIELQKQINLQGVTKASGYFKLLTLRKKTDGKEYPIIATDAPEQIILKDFHIDQELYVKCPFYLFPYELFNYARYGNVEDTLDLEAKKRNEKVAALIISLATYQGKLIIFQRIIIPWLQFHKLVRYLFGISINFTIYWSLVAAFLYYSFDKSIPTAYTALTFLVEPFFKFAGGLVRLFCKYCFTIYFVYVVLFVILLIYVRLKFNSYIMNSFMNSSMN